MTFIEKAIELVRARGGAEVVVLYNAPQIRFVFVHADPHNRGGVLVENCPIEPDVARRVAMLLTAAADLAEGKPVPAGPAPGETRWPL